MSNLFDRAKPLKKIKAKRVSKPRVKAKRQSRIKHVNHFGEYRGNKTSEGYKIYTDREISTAVNEFDEAVYRLD